MLKIISNMPIFRRLFYAFMLAAVVPGIAITILGFTFVNTLRTRGNAIHASLAALQDTSSVATYVPRINDALNLLYNARYGSGSVSAQAPSATAIQAVHDLETQFTNAIANYQQNYLLASSPPMSAVSNVLLGNSPNDPIVQQQQALMQQIIINWPAYRQLQDKALRAIAAGIPLGQASNDIKLANNAFVNVRDNWNALVKVTGTISSKVAQVGPEEMNPIVLITAIAFFIILVVVVTIGYVVNRTITEPLRQLAALTRRIAQGETTARAQIVAQDEIYMVATSMNNMLDNIVHLIQETQAQRDNLQTQVEKLVSEVSGVGEGDLRIQAEVTANALGVLADSFNYMVEELGSLVVRVKLVANEVEKSTTTILDHMTQLVESGDTQIRQIEQAATELEHMAGSSRQVAERTQVAYEVARNARENAQTGRYAVQQAIEGMGRINTNVQDTASKVQALGDRSREIEEIVNVIGGLAHQTNRLALDAAIQAAMAGENGKGFGAVAADIRRLAERAKEQTGMIAHIVRNVLEEIGIVAVAIQDTERETSTGTQLTYEVGISLESLFSAVEQQARAVESINALATQQLQTSSAVVQIMHGVSDATRQSNISTHEASQSMERLARLVEQLRSSVEAFKLRENQGYLNGAHGINGSLDSDSENPLSISGLFRTVSATTQSTANGSSSTSGKPASNALPPPRVEDPLNAQEYLPSAPPLYTPMPSPASFGQIRNSYGNSANSMDQNQFSEQQWYDAWDDSLPASNTNGKY